MAEMNVEKEIADTPDQVTAEIIAKCEEKV